MPRARRILPVHLPVHVINRGNDRRQLFFEARDYQAFLDSLAEATSLHPVEVFGYCLMPTHFHLLLRQREAGGIPAYVHRVAGCSACYFRQVTESRGLGHVYQRRYWSHVIADELHYLTVLRYIEANALRAKLVRRAEDWQWGSLWERLTGGRALLAPSLQALPADWSRLVNEAQPEDQLRAVRTVDKRGRPRKKGPGPF